MPALSQRRSHRRGDLVPETPQEPLLSPSTRARVALVHLGNRGGLGTLRRVQVWQGLLEAAGACSFEVHLLGDHRRLIPSASGTVRAFRGQVVPESAVWSVATAEQAIKAISPDLVLFVTPRAFHPRLAALGQRSILDFQDLFSQSYRGRAMVDRRPGAKMAWQTLAWFNARFERRDHRVMAITAGFSEAQELGATWIPNTVDSSPASTLTDHADALFDLVFLGKLSSLPNVDALRSIAHLWPRLNEEIPQLTLLAAGAQPSTEIVSMARTYGWAIHAGFDQVESVCQQARIAMVPLRYASGIQNKVLEAAAAGLPQVLSPQALGGIAPGFPALVVRTREELVAAVRMLLAEPRRRLQLAAEAHAHVASNYSVARWGPVVASLLEGSDIARPRRSLIGPFPSISVAEPHANESDTTSARRAPLDIPASKEPIDT